MSHPSFDYHAIATVRQYIQELLSLLGGIQISNKDEREIMNYIQTNGASAGSDGSVKNGKGGHAFYISDIAFTKKIWGQAPMAGSHREISSLWAEHGGALGILILIQALFVF